MVGGEIKVVMTLDNGSFLVQTMKAGKALYSVRKTLDDTAQSVKTLETKFTSFGQRFQDVTLRISLLRFALRDVYDIFLRIPKAILDTTGEFQRMTTLLEGMSKEVDANKRSLEALSGKKYIIEIAMNSPFKIEAIQDAFVKFKSVGLDPTNGSMKALIESVAKFGGSSDLLHRSSIAIQQMISKGVVSMEELRQQLGEAIPDAMQKMAQGTGVTMGELVKQVSKGVVEAQSAITNMLAIMAVENQGAAEKLSKTWPGLMARISTSATLAMNEIGESGFAENMQAQMEKVLKIMNSMDFSNMARDLGRFLSGVVDVGVSVVKFFRTWGSEIKVVSAVLATLYIGNKFGTLIVDMQKAFMQKKVLLQTEVALVKANELEKATEIATTLNTKRTLERAAYTSTSRELDAAKAKHAAHNAAIINLENARALAVKRRGDAGAIGFDKAHAKEMYAYQQKMAQSSRYVAQLTAERAAHQANFLAMNRQAGAQAAYITRIGQTSTALTSLKGVMVGMKGAFVAMGGWVTVLTTGVIYMTVKIIEWANRAKTAARELQDAQAGRTGKKEYADNTGVVDEAKAKVDAARKRLSDEEAAQASGKTNKDFEHIANLKASLVRQTESYIKALNKDRLLRKNALMEGTRKHLETLQFTTSEKVKAIHTAGMAEIKALQEQQQKNPQLNLSKQINDKVKKLAVDQLNYLKGRQSEITAGFQVAKGEQKAVHAEYVRFIDEEVKMQEMMVANLSGVGTMTFMKDKDKDAAGGKTPADHWADALQTLREKVADLNGELNKKGSGDMLKLIEDLKGKGVDMGADKLNLLKEIFSDMNGMELDIKLRDDSQAALQQAENYLEGLKEKAEGGSSAVGKMRDKLLDLLALGNNPETVANLTKALNATDESAAIEAAQRYEKSEKAALSYQAKAKQIGVSMIDDRREALRQEYLIEVENEKAKILLRRTTEEITAEGYALEMENFGKLQAAMFQKLQRDSLSPFRQTLRQWQNTTDLMGEATSGWLDQSKSAMLDFVTTGKLSFRSLAVSIMKDIADIMLKKAIAGMVNMAIGAVTSGGGASGDTVGSMMSSQYSGFDSSTIISHASSQFADGGIMTSFGSLALKKYANGGVANRPQLAMFGEGKTPEAYVPLPDGRSIPVTMSGGAGGGDNVEINITVHEGESGGESSTSNGDGQAMWKGLGEKIKGVVLNELMVQKRPGGVLYSR